MEALVLEEERRRCSGRMVALHHNKEGRKEGGERRPRTERQA